ncbi:hypothetical protein Droror1_Dr00007544 [Drosera rotundifolia]
MVSLILPAKFLPPLSQTLINLNPHINSSSKPKKPTLSFTSTHQLNHTDTHLLHLFESGRTQEAISALDAIAHKGLKVSSRTYTKLLDCCVESNSIDLGRELHARVDVVDDLDPFVGTKLVGMYSKCGSLAGARKAFNEMPERNVYSWGALIGAYSRENRWEEVVGLFGMMVEEGILPSHFLVPKILKACGNCGDYEMVRLVHSIVVRCGFGCYTHVCNGLTSAYVRCGWLSLAWEVFTRMMDRDVVSWNSIVYAYCRVGMNDEARRFFEMMRDEDIEPGLRTWNILIDGYCQSGDCDTALNLKKEMEGVELTPDIFTWTSLISGFAKSNREVRALQLFIEMLSLGVQPTGVTIATVVSACSTLKASKNRKVIHGLASRMGLAKTVLVGNSLLDLYSKCGELKAARQVFDAILERDVCTWNSMISGYCQGGYFAEAYELFIKMQESGSKPNAITWNLIISAYIRTGDEEEAMHLFQKMGKGGIIEPDTSSWNSLISAYLQIGDKNKAFRIFRKMQSLGIRLNSVTILTILDAFGILVAANKVREIHTYTLRRDLVSEISVSNCLIDSYSKSGNIVYSKAIFDMMRLKDVITWNSLIAGYVFHGCSKDALVAFDQMMCEGHKPNRITLLSLIRAYSLEKMVKQGMLIFSSMTEEYHVLPGSEHQSAVVHLLGRSGRLGEAIKFVEQMTSEPDPSIWHALLTASRVHGNVRAAIHAGERLLELNPGDNVTRRIISHAYRISGRGSNTLEEAAMLCGSSSVEVGNMIYSFDTGHVSAPAFVSTYVWLKGITRNINQPDPNLLSYVEEEDNEEISGVHSEKLALCFALNATAHSIRPIRIMKNFRICRDCHGTFKSVSSSCSREIYLSDRQCLHHFKNGHCSCGDYW